MGNRVGQVLTEATLLHLLREMTSNFPSPESGAVGEHPSGEVVETASIITQEAQGELATIHSRMPVFMPQDRWDTWLNPRNTDVNELKSLMVVEHPESIVKAHPVSSAVNSCGK
jgi:putative SOS response-associated peptidase YedK